MGARAPRAPASSPRGMRMASGRRRIHGVQSNHAQASRSTVGPTPTSIMLAHRFRRFGGAPDVHGIRSIRRRPIFGFAQPPVFQRHPEPAHEAARVREFAPEHFWEDFARLLVAEGPAKELPSERSDCMPSAGSCSSLPEVRFPKVSRSSRLWRKAATHGPAELPASGPA